MTDTLSDCGSILEEGEEEFKVEKVVAEWSISVESRKATEEEITSDEKRKAGLTKEDEKCRMTEDIVEAEVDPKLLSIPNGEGGKQSSFEESIEEVEDLKETALYEIDMKSIGVKKQSNEWERLEQIQSDEVEVKNLCPKADGGAPLATQRVPSDKTNLVQSHSSSVKPVLVTIFEEDENDLEVGNELAGVYGEGDDDEATLEEDPGAETCCLDGGPNLLSCVDLHEVKESIESPAEHTPGGEQELSFKLVCLKDDEEVTKVEKPSSAENFLKSEQELREDTHLREMEDYDELGQSEDNSVSHYQTASRTLSNEVLSGLRGLDGAILLLQKARLDLLRQVLHLTIM